MVSLRSLVLLAVGSLCAAGTNVAVLTDHKSDAWDKATTTCANSNEDLVKCNLKLFGMAAAQAGKLGVEMLVLPEGYALGANTDKSDYFEPFDMSIVGKTPCKDFNATRQPALFSLSCAATGNVALSSNIFTVNSTGFRHITEIVFDKYGVIESAYHKNHLFPTEAKVITPGPFRPTAFDMLGRRWGIVICYEGIYPSITGDWAQLDDLVHRQNATALVWSVGNTGGLLKSYAVKIAKRYKVPVLATEDYELITKKGGSGFIVDASGAVDAGVVDTPITGLGAIGYSASPYLRHAAV